MILGPALVSRQKGLSRSMVTTMLGLLIFLFIGPAAGVARAPEPMPNFSGHQARYPFPAMVPAMGCSAAVMPVGRGAVAV